MITETTITEEDESGTSEPQGFHLLVMSLEVFWSQRLPASGVVTVGRSKKCEVQIDDAMASREHARIHIGSDGGVPVLTIEDVGSANGTRVRDTVIKPSEPAAILPGEAITVGSTVLMVMQDRPTTGLRRIWSHAYFEARVEDECVRAAKTRPPFALARIRFTGAAPWTRVTPVLARELGARTWWRATVPRTTRSCSWTCSRTRRRAWCRSWWLLSRRRAWARSRRSPGIRRMAGRRTRCWRPRIPR